MAKRERKRLDGVGPLTKDQKRERDARAQYWMNQRKIERVRDAAWKGGWVLWPGARVDAIVESGSVRSTDQELILLVPDDGEYRFYTRDEHDRVLLRKILSYKEINDAE